MAQLFSKEKHAIFLGYGNIVPPSSTYDVRGYAPVSKRLLSVDISKEGQEITERTHKNIIIFNLEMGKTVEIFSTTPAK